MSLEESRLIRRYLLWCYKTTKEDLDRIDRKFTQLKVDSYILHQLQKTQKGIFVAIKQRYAESVENFRSYKDKKQHEALEQKFFDANKKIPQAHYVYLRNRLRAIEEAIRHFLGQKELRAIQYLYEEEMTRRILEAREQG